MSAPNTRRDKTPVCITCKQKYRVYGSGDLYVRTLCECEMKRPCDQCGKFYAVQATLTEQQVNLVKKYLCTRHAHDEYLTGEEPEVPVPGTAPSERYVVTPVTEVPDRVVRCVGCSHEHRFTERKIVQLFDTKTSRYHVTSLCPRCKAVVISSSVFEV